MILANWLVIEELTQGVRMAILKVGDRMGPASFAVAIIFAAS